ncbi:MAG: hypothetical protein AAFU78_19050 [Cyanobacteria bacterium J06633_2]
MLRYFKASDNRYLRNLLGGEGSDWIQLGLSGSDIFFQFHPVGFWCIDGWDFKVDLLGEITIEMPWVKVIVRPLSDSNS